MNRQRRIWLKSNGKWEIVINQLYITQSRKEAADRSSAIALAEGSLSDNNIDNGVKIIANSGSTFNGCGVNSCNSGSTFNGCGVNSYPLISGTFKVVSVNVYGYKLASGHSIIYGACSDVKSCNTGDLIAYSGYIVNGVVNALRIKRVLLS